MNGTSAEKAPAAFPETPKVAWKENVGTGASAVSVAAGRAYTMGNNKDVDSVFCFDVKTGKRLWVHTYPLAVDSRMFEGGPAATPTVDTIDGNKVYTVSHQGDLFCLDAATGAKKWYKHYQQDFGGRRPQWGFAGSPTVHGNLLICDMGGENASTVALDKNNGAVVWKSGSDMPGYGSAVVANIGGVSTVVVFKAEALVGLDAKDGHELWRTKWKTDYDVNSATPLIKGNQIFITSGYGRGCALFEVKEGKISQVWTNKVLRSHINTPALVGNFLYGIDGQTGPNSPLVCVDWATGERKWSDKAVGGGAVIALGNNLVAITERGELVVANASPEGFKQTMRAKALDGRCWVQPTYADGRLFVRNNQGELVCYDLGAH